MSRGGTASEDNINSLVYNRVLKKGVQGTDVTALQLALKKLGYYKSNATSLVFDNATYDAVVAFQKANKLTVDGMAGQQTINKINELLKKQGEQNTSSGASTQTNTTGGTNSSSGTNTTTQSKVNNTTNNVMQLIYTRPLKIGVRGEDVKKLQEALKKLGYLNIATTTTYFGTNTQAAVKAFQKANKLTVDGMVGQQTIKKINERLK
ncbi:peptidoglycan-binding domain-containing protein [Caloramator sp. mosi_1]|uniref:peptidoglycan-binding domain-containing protein n=1 Tax=Caloramator sp. mosi_1 TaxID=3023090 RepID=UPI0023608602|nr:peptidoglycan-binding protein [Caloramator sp. mosi_1]WDC84143.1 peptidoglycan-binding domain-containing protein [Caloramator sp. mosi_1]